MRSLTARGPFDSLYFIRISLLTVEIIFYLGVDVGVGGGIFLFLNNVIIIWYMVLK